MLRKALNPKYLIPIILLIAVVAALLAFGNVNKVLRLMTGFDRTYLIWFMLLMLAYTAVRGLQWHILLRALGIRVPLRAQIFAFLMGEMTKSLPIGNYFQNYILQRSRGADFGRTSAASTIVIVTEVVVSLLGCAVIGVGGWPWIRPLILIGGALFLAGSFLFVKVHDPSAPPQWMTRRKWLRKAVEELKNFREGAADLMHPRVLALEAACSAAYLILAGTGLWLICHGLATNISFPAALSVYFFSLAVSLILPLPVDLGAVEISGTGAFIAYGVDKSAAVGIMLINRFLSFASTLVIVLAGMAIFRDELHKALHERAQARQRERDGRQGDTPTEDPGDEHEGEHAHRADTSESKDHARDDMPDDMPGEGHHDDVSHTSEQPTAPTPAGTP